MRNLAIFLLLCLTLATRAGTVDPTYTFSDFTAYPLNVSRVTITPLARDAYYSGAVLSTKPLVYTKSAYPTLTNGTFTATNLVNGYAYRVEIADSYQTTTVTNYFATNVTGSVDAVDYLTPMLGLEQGVVVRAFFENGGSSTGGEATNVFFLASTNITPTVTGGSNVFTVTGQVPSATAAVTATNLAFSDAYTAWVSKSGSDTTGAVGKRELPFLTVSNAIVAVKSALGSTATNGTIYVGAGSFVETWVNLQRTNLPGLNLIGVSPQVTMLVGSSTSYLTNIGPLVVLGHSSKLCNLTISNNVNFAEKQAAFGYDASRSTSAGTTLVVPTNNYVGNVAAIGSSDAAYFYDAGGGSHGLWLDNVYLQSRWDALFLNTAATDGNLLVTRSVIKVEQPDNYSFPGGGSGTGRARAVYVGDGYFRIENSSVSVVGGANATNETTAITVNNGAAVASTNMNTTLAASTSGTGTLSLAIYSDTPYFIGKLYPGTITTNSPFAGSFSVATSAATAKQTLDLSSGTNIAFAGFSEATKTAITNAGSGGGGGDVYKANNNAFSGSNYFGGVTRFFAPVGMSNATIFNNSTWSINNLIWSYSTGSEIRNYGNINNTNNPSTTLDWWDVSANKMLFQLEPDANAADPHVYLLNPRGNGNGLTNLAASAVTANFTGTGTYMTRFGTNANASGSGDVLNGQSAVNFTTIRANDVIATNNVSTTNALYVGGGGTFKANGVSTVINSNRIDTGNIVATGTLNSSSNYNSGNEYIAGNLTVNGSLTANGGNLTGLTYSQITAPGRILTNGEANLVTLSNGLTVIGTITSTSNNVSGGISAGSISTPTLAVSGSASIVTTRYSTNLAGTSVSFVPSRASYASLTNYTFTGVSNKDSTGTNYNTALLMLKNISSTNITYTFTGGFTNCVSRTSTNWSGNVLTLEPGITAAVIVDLQEGGTTNIFSSR